MWWLSYLGVAVIVRSGRSGDECLANHEDPWLDPKSFWSHDTLEVKPSASTFDSSKGWAQQLVAADHKHEWLKDRSALFMSYGKAMEAKGQGMLIVVDPANLKTTTGWWAKPDCPFETTRECLGGGGNKPSSWTRSYFEIAIDTFQESDKPVQTWARGGKADIVGEIDDDNLGLHGLLALRNDQYFLVGATDSGKTCVLERIWVCETSFTGAPTKFTNYGRLDDGSQCSLTMQRLSTEEIIEKIQYVDTGADLIATLESAVAPELVGKVVKKIVSAAPELRPALKNVGNSRNAAPVAAETEAEAEAEGSIKETDVKAKLPSRPPSGAAVLALVALAM